MINLKLICLDLGKIFSALSLLDILNNCIPPTFIIGISVIAITIIPIPPSHWRMARQSNMLFGAISKLTITVEPVVVIPDILSKKASVIFKFKLENTNGKEPKMAILNHESAVNKKAWGKLNFLSWSRFDKKNKIPKIIVIIPELINEESNSLYIDWIIIGIIMANPKITCNTPSVKNTVL